MGAADGVKITAIEPEAHAPELLELAVAAFVLTILPWQSGLPARTSQKDFQAEQWCRSRLPG